MSKKKPEKPPQPFSFGTGSVPGTVTDSAQQSQGRAPNYLAYLKSSR